jgi:hypothetical protein
MQTQGNDTGIGLEFTQGAVDQKRVPSENKAGSLRTRSDYRKSLEWYSIILRYTARCLTFSLPRSLPVIHMKGIHRQPLGQIEVDACRGIRTSTQQDEHRPELFGTRH